MRDFSTKGTAVIFNAGMRLHKFSPILTLLDRFLELGLNMKNDETWAYWGDIDK